MIPKLSPTEPTTRWICAVLGIDPRVFDRTYGCRKDSYARYPPFVAQRSSVWAVMRAVWGWSYPTIAYVTNSPNHSTVMDRLKDDGYMAPGVLEELAKWAHAHYDSLGEYAPPTPDYRLSLSTSPIVVQVRAEADAPPPKPPATVRKQRHGCDCKCSACVELTDLSRRLLARNPDLRVTMLEPMVRPFVRELQQRRAMGMTA